MLELYIGNKNYSSWSLRAWLLLTQLGIGFTEHRLSLDSKPGSPFKEQLLALAPTGRVPLLVDAGFAVWDTLAIVEYVAERFPDRGVWPREAHARARARCLCAEMHAGFGALRDRFPMNIEAALPDVGPRVLREHPAVAADVARIESMWSEQLGASGGPFLFGAFSAADAFHAPVCSRLRTYGVPLPAAASAYVDRIHALPSMRAWCEAACAEHEFIVEDEPYRTQT